MRKPPGWRFGRAYLTLVHEEGDAIYISFIAVYLKSSNEFWLRQVKPNRQFLF